MQGNDSYRLIVRRGPQPNQVYELSEEVMNLGRDITNNIVINDREVSRHHLRLMRGAEGYTIEDLGSTNGTFINGKRVSGAQALKNGDMVSLGETVTLGYELVRAQGGQAPSAAAPSAPAPSPSAPSAPSASPANDSPYQPPKAADPYVPPVSASPPAQAYQPPAQQPAPQQNYSPYQPPAAQQPPASQGAYPQQDPYGQQDYGQQDQAYYGPPQGAAYGTPPPPGYDYDPYKMREEEESSPWRWVLIGCLGLMLFCCCITVVAAIAIDTLNLYCSVPVLNNVLEAVGLVRCG